MRYQYTPNVVARVFRYCQNEVIQTWNNWICIACIANGSVKVCDDFGTVKCVPTLWPRQATPRDFSQKKKKRKTLCASKNLLTKFIEVSFIMAKPETIQMSNRRRDNYIVVHSYSGIPLYNRKKCLLLHTIT